jgi:hypothetical protein
MDKPDWDTYFEMYRDYVETQQRNPEYDTYYRNIHLGKWVHDQVFLYIIGNQPEHRRVLLVAFPHFVMLC